MLGIPSPGNSSKTTCSCCYPSLPLLLSEAEEQNVSASECLEKNQIAPVQEDNPCLVAGDQEKVAVRGEEDVVYHLQKDQENQEDKMGKD